MRPSLSCPTGKRGCEPRRSGLTFVLVSVAVLGLLSAEIRPAHAQSDVCLGSEPFAMGMFLAFTITCACSKADSTKAEQVYESFTEELCGPEFAHEAEEYFEFTLGRGDLIRGRCSVVCEAPLGIMLSSILNAASGFETTVTTTPENDGWGFSPEVLEEVTKDVRAEFDRASAAERQQGNTEADPYDSSDHTQEDIYAVPPGGDTYANPICRTQPSSPKCRRMSDD